MFFNPGVCDLSRGKFFLLLQTLLAQLPNSHRKQQDLCNNLQSHQNGNYLQIITNVPLVSLVVHTAENFLNVFMFLLCRWYRQQGLRAVHFPCATTLLLGYARNSLWMVSILPNCTRWSLLPSEPLRSYKHWVHLVLRRTQNLFGGSEMLLLSQCCPQDPTTEVLKIIVLQYNSARSLIRKEISLCLILCGSAETTIRKKTRFLEADGYTWPLRSLP
jgi:hypothetical protein